MCCHAGSTIVPAVLKKCIVELIAQVGSHVLYRDFGFLFAEHSEVNNPKGYKSSFLCYILGPRNQDVVPGS